MLKEFSTKLRERSCGEQEYIKQVDVADFVKYDKDNLWRTSNDVIYPQLREELMILVLV